MTPRAFGTEATDLDLRFGRRPAEAVVTDLLQRCLGEDTATLQRWTLARRFQALLALRCADEPEARASLALHCSACGSAFEFELPLAACQQTVDETPLAVPLADGRLLQLRLPDADDLQRWRAQGQPDEHTLAASLLLQPAEALDTTDIENIAEQLAQRDPFTALRLQADCPDCGQAHAPEIDIEALLLRDFAARQQRLLDEVATLARAFHWSEAQILALPAWRRAFYLSRVDAAPLEWPA
ncbi:MAG: hypothetical protein WAQ05_03095 [Rubrivivax sp.]